jgi:hypothetical protein
VRLYLQNRLQLWPTKWAILIPFALALSGCQKEEIKFYTAPKDAPEPAQVAERDSQPEATPHRQRPRPQVAWKLPQGWKEDGPSTISLANFSVSGAEGKQAEVSITQLGNLTGKDAFLVNMFRQQLGLPELGEEEVHKQFQEVQVGSEKGNLFELIGKRKDETFRIITAIIHQPEGSWFYRISGDPDLVANQKPLFLEFLKSIQIKEAPASESGAVASKFNWTVPATWKEIPAGDMQVARFTVPEKDGAKGEVFVSMFDSKTGTTLANVNRWRNQIGLAPVEEKDLASLISSLDPSNPEAILVDMKKGDRQIIGAVVPREGRYWFYKLLGDSEVVSSQKDSFTAFAKSKP